MLTIPMNTTIFLGLVNCMLCFLVRWNRMFNSVASFPFQTSYPSVVLLLLFECFVVFALHACLFIDSLSLFLGDKREQSKQWRRERCELIQSKTWASECAWSCLPSLISLCFFLSRTCMLVECYCCCWCRCCGCARCVLRFALCVFFFLLAPSHTSRLNRSQDRIDM